MKAEDFAALPLEFQEELLARLRAPAFARKLGLVAEEVRQDYCRMRMPYDPEHDQPMGVVHGGAIASLIDTVVIGAIFSRMPTLPKKIATVDLHIHYLAPLQREDAIAEAWIRRRGRSMIYLAADVATPNGTVVAHGELAYHVVL